MDIQELIDRLRALPPAAKAKPALFVFRTQTGEARLEINIVDFDLTTVSLRA